MKFIQFIRPALFGTAMLWSLVGYGQVIKNPLWMYYDHGKVAIPMGALPMQYNSSFAGESDGARFNSVFALERYNKNFEKQHLGLHATYDQFVPALGSGIGITVHSGSQMNLFGGREYNARANSVSLAIAPKISIKGKYTLSPSIDFSYGRGQVEANHPNENLSFIDQSRGKHEWFESRVGLLFNTSKYYIGYTAYLMNQSYHNGQRSELPHLRYIFSVQAGYTFQRSAESKFSFTPQITYLYGEGVWNPYEDTYFHTLVFNFNFRYDQYLAGINNTGFHLGWQNEKLRVMVSSHPFLNDKVFTNGNLSLRYLFKD